MSSPLSDRDEVYQDSIDSRLAERDALIRRVLEAVEGAGVAVDRHFDRLCIDELLINAIVHGNGQDPTKKVTVRVFRSATHWGIEVADEGEGFDGEAQLRELRDLEVNLESSGRGLALIAATGAEIRFLDGGSRVRMVRRR